MKRNRWNAIGRTRRKLAAILTTAIRTRSPSLGAVTVAPEDVKAMRLVGRARVYEDAHSWEACARSERTGNILFSAYSYDSMTTIVRAGGVEWLAELPGRCDGECVAASRQK